MNSTLSKILIFGAGALAGSLITWKVVKDKYEQIISELEGEYEQEPEEVEQEEAQDVNEHFKEVKEARKNYRSMVRSFGYSNVEVEGKDVFTPEIIPPDEFGDIDDYETNSLNYYKDGIVADDDGNIIENVDEILGIDFFSHFGEYEDDSVHVRNKELRTDYEVLMDYRTYDEAFPQDVED